MCCLIRKVFIFYKLFKKNVKIMKKLIFFLLKLVSEQLDVIDVKDVKRH